MKAITLWQPWATYVTLKFKTIETRTHDRFKSLKGQRIAVHAGLKVDKSGLLNEYLYLKIKRWDVDNIVRFIRMCRGQLVCTATVADARWAPNVDFEEREEWNKKAMCDVAGRFCLFLEDIKPFRGRIPGRGRQGIFEVPDKVIKEGMYETT